MPWFWRIVLPLVWSKETLRQRWPDESIGSFEPEHPLPAINKERTCVLESPPIMADLD